MRVFSVSISAVHLCHQEIVVDAQIGTEYLRDRLTQHPCRKGLSSGIVMVRVARRRTGTVWHSERDEELTQALSRRGAPKLGEARDKKRHMNDDMIENDDSPVEDRNDTCEKSEQQTQLSRKAMTSTSNGRRPQKKQEREATERQRSGQRSETIATSRGQPYAPHAS